MFIKRMSIAFRTLDWQTLLLEFFLLAAGVFVGLQVDAWNDRRLDRISSYDSLAAVKEELQRQLETYERMSWNAQSWIKYTRYLERVAEDPKLAQEYPEQLPRAILLSAYASNFPMPVGVYRQMESNAEFDLIENKELVSAIRAHYLELEMWQRVNKRIDYIPDNYSVARAGLFTIDEYHALMTGEGERLDDMAIPGFDGEDALRLASILSQDKAFLKWLPEMYWFHLGSVNLAGSEIPQIEELKRAIELELLTTAH